MEVEPGDLFFLHPLMPHRSGVNSSLSCRRTLFFQYASAEYGDSSTRSYAAYHERMIVARTPEQRARAFFA